MKTGLLYEKNSRGILHKYNIPLHEVLYTRIIDS